MTAQPFAYWPDPIEPEDDEQPEPWELWLAGAEPHNIVIRDYVGYGPDAEERDVEVEVRPNYPQASEVFGR